MTEEILPAVVICEGCGGDFDPNMEPIENGLCSHCWAPEGKKMTEKKSTKPASLAEALLRAQAEYPPIEKKREAVIVTTKGKYRYDYADLNDVIGAVRPVLNKHGVFLVQRTSLAENGMILHTELHFGEEKIASEWPLALQPQPTQTGANLAYYRRYALTALLGIAAEETTDENAEGGADQAVKKKAKVEPHKGAVPMSGKLGKAQLQQEIRELASHIEGAADVGELAGILHDHQEIMEQCMKDIPGWWYGDDRNPNYESMEARIDRRRKELTEREPGMEG